MGPSPEQATLRDVVALLYRADWTTLSLSATYTSWTDWELRTRMHGTHPPVGPDGEEQRLRVTEHRQHLLVAPGGKYRTGEDTGDGRVDQIWPRRPGARAGSWWRTS